MKFSNTATIISIDNVTFNNPTIYCVLLNITDFVNIPNIISGCIFNNDGITPQNTPPYNIHANDMTIRIFFLNASGDLAIDDNIAESLDLDPSNKIFWGIGNSPIITKPNDTIVEQDATNVYINWTIFDVDQLEGTYTVYVNGVALENHIIAPWYNDSVISIPVNTTILGIYNYTIIFTDGLHTLSDTVIVYVAESIPPGTKIFGFDLLILFASTGLFSIIFIIWRKKIKQRN